MLWYQAWVETRWRFAIALLVLLALAVGSVYDYLAVLKLMPLAGAMETATLSRRLREAIELQRTFDGYIWVQWFRQTMTSAGTLAAVLLGCGSALSRGSEGAVLFTLSLPVSRARLLAVRCMTGLAEWLVLAVVSSLAVSLVAPAIGQHYDVGRALVHGLSVFMAGSLFYSAAMLLSSLLPDVWRPLLVTCAVAVVVAIAESMMPARGVGVFRVMSAETYFFTGALPWPGWTACLAGAAALAYAAVRRLERRDF